MYIVGDLSSLLQERAAMSNVNDPGKLPVVFATKI